METTKKSLKQWFKEPKTKKILSVILNTLIWLFVIFSLAITVLVFSAQGSKDGVPSVFGKSLITISTRSMEPTYEVGDLVFMEKISSEDIDNLEVGQIITFHAPIDLDNDGKTGDINTHRIYKIEGNRFITAGDLTGRPDNEGDTPYTVHASDIIGTCTEDGKIAGLGNVISFLRSSLGFFLCIVLPLILFFLYELYNFINIIISEKAKKAAAGAAPIDEEAIKKKAIEEYLAKQKDEEEIKKRAIEEYLAREAENKNSDSKEEK